MERSACFRGSPRIRLQFRLCYVHQTIVKPARAKRFIYISAALILNKTPGSNRKDALVIKVLYERVQKLPINRDIIVQ